MIILSDFLGVPTRNLSPHRHDGAVATVAEIANRVREVLGLDGVQLTIVDRGGRRTPLHLGRGPGRRVILDLGETHRVVSPLRDPDENSDSLAVAALLARDLAPAATADDWDLLAPRIAWVLGRLGGDVDRSMAIVAAVIDADGVE